MLDILVLWFIIWTLVQLVTAQQTKVIILVIGLVLVVIWLGLVTVGHHSTILH